MYKKTKEFLQSIFPDDIWVLCLGLVRVFRRLKFRIKLGAPFESNKKIGLSTILAIDLEKRQFISTACIENCNYGRVMSKFPKLLSYSEPVFFDDIIQKKNLQTICLGSGVDLLLDDVDIIGESNLVLLNRNKVIYELKSHPESHRFNFTDAGIRSYNDMYCLIDSTSTAGCHDTVEEGIKLTANFSWNFYHVLFEIIAKFHRIKELAINKNVPLVVDKACFEVGQLAQLIDYFNEDKRPIIVLEKRKRLHVKKLYFLSEINCIPPDYKTISEVLPQDTLYDLNSLHFIRSSLLSKKGNGSYPSRLFISRKNASGRRRYNEAEVGRILSQYGFHEICPEDYPICEQITMFNNAEFIVGATGAAFSNILFCKPGAKILCFTNFRFRISVFSTLAKFVGAEMCYLYDVGLTNSNLVDIHRAFRVDPDILTSFLNSKLSK